MQGYTHSIGPDNVAVIRIDLDKHEALYRDFLRRLQQAETDLPDESYTLTDVGDDLDSLKHVSNDPAFEFLKHPEEDIYTLEDGKPLEDAL